MSVAFLEETLETRNQALRALSGARCRRTMRVPAASCSFGEMAGLVLGFATALLGRNGIWICTAAVEGGRRTGISRISSISFVAATSRSTHLILEHSGGGAQPPRITRSNSSQVAMPPGREYCAASISRVTDAVIWLSTWGDSRRMARELAAARVPVELHRGSVVSPIRYLSTACAAWRPSRIAHTTSDWPRRMSPAENTFGFEVW